MDIIGKIKRNPKKSAIVAAVGIVGVSIAYLTLKNKFGFSSDSIRQGLVEAHYPSRDRGLVTIFKSNFGAVNHDYMIEY